MEEQKDRRMIVVCVRDNKSGIFNNPTTVDSVEVAKRNFRLVLRSAKDVTPFSEFPEDFDLYQVGYWSSWTLLEPCPLTLLMAGSEVKAS